MLLSSSGMPCLEALGEMILFSLSRLLSKLTCLLVTTICSVMMLILAIVAMIMPMVCMCVCVYVHVCVCACVGSVVRRRFFMPVERRLVCKSNIHHVKQ